MSEQRPCVPEWCEQGGPAHDDTCDNAPMKPMTKRQFVEFQAAAADIAVQTYEFMLGEGFAKDQAKEAALSDAEEAAVCFAGIGSCGRGGWCRHS